MKQIDLEELKKVDVRTVDVSALEDIEKVKVDRSLSVGERGGISERKLKIRFALSAMGWL